MRGLLRVPMGDDGYGHLYTNPFAATVPFWVPRRLSVLEHATRGAMLLLRGAVLQPHPNGVEIAGLEVHGAAMLDADEPEDLEQLLGFLGAIADDKWITPREVSELVQQWKENR